MPVKCPKCKGEIEIAADDDPASAAMAADGFLRIQLACQDRKSTKPFRCDTLETAIKQAISS